MKLNEPAKTRTCFYYRKATTRERIWTYLYCLWDCVLFATQEFILALKLLLGVRFVFIALVTPPKRDIFDAKEVTESDPEWEKAVDLEDLGRSLKIFNSPEDDGGSGVSN